jgi:Protein of unknown function (DUF4038)/Domain of unknown function (DUF5060)
MLPLRSIALAALVTLWMGSRALAVPALVVFTPASPGEIETQDFFEVEDRPSELPVGNPFVDAQLTATLTGPDGHPVVVEGFCDSADGSVYRVRFLATRAGTHRYQLLFKNGATTARFAGVFVAKKSSRKGMLRVDKNHPFHFVWEGTGEHYFWNGTTAYYLLGFDDDAVIDGALDRLARLKVNRVRVTLFGREASAAGWNEKQFKTERGFQIRVSPWPAARPDNIEDPGFDLTRFDVKHFQKTERMLKHAREKDIAVALIFFLDGMRPGRDPFGAAGAGGQDERRYYRYAVARFAAYSNVMWDLANEYRHYRTDAWANETGVLVKKVDPYDHLTSIHGHWEFFLRRSAWVDMALFQIWDDCGNDVFIRNSRQVQQATGRAIPQINDEYGYEDTYPLFGCGESGARVAPGRSPETRRRLAWRIAMAGGYQTTGERVSGAPVSPPSPANLKPVRNAGGWINGLGSDDTMLTLNGHAMTFITSFPWWKMEPRVDVSSHGSLALVEKGQRVAVWMPATPRSGLLLVTVGSGTWSGHWFDPRTAQVIPVEAFSGPSFESVPPGPGDWALLLERKK